MACASGPASPTWTFTWSTLTRRFALGTESNGSEASSTTSRLIGLPRTPPAAFTCASAAFSPWLTPAPNGANWPVSEISEPKTIEPELDVFVVPVVDELPEADGLVPELPQAARTASAVPSDAASISRLAPAACLWVMPYMTPPVRPWSGSLCALFARSGGLAAGGPGDSLGAGGEAASALGSSAPGDAQ